MTPYRPSPDDRTILRQTIERIHGRSGLDMALRLLQDEARRLARRAREAGDDMQGWII